MTTTRHVLATGNFLQNWSNTGLITVNDNWSGVPSIVGYLGQDITTATGTNPQTLTGDSSVANDVDVIANQLNPNTQGAGGVAEFEIADPVVALQGSGTADAPHLIVYLDATGRENVVFSFRARDLDGSTDNAIQQVAVQYRVGGTGPWINLPAGYIADATTGPSTLGADTLVSVTLPSSVNGASDLQVRVITTNAVGNDEWVGIDDISVTSDAIPPGPGIFAISDAAVAEGNAGTTPITFTVNRTDGVDGAVTVDYSVTFTGTAAASAGDFAPGQVFTGTLSWAAGDAAPKTITLNVRGDVVVEPNETFTVTLFNATGGASISDATGAGQITNDDSGPVAIYSIQGAAHTSPFTGATVTTTGIVTAVDSNGYYLQDASGDGDDATSDAIFVFTSGAPTVNVSGVPQPIQIGDSLTVTGTVTEFAANATSLSLTELTGTVAVRNSQGNSLPAAVLIGTGGRTPPTENYEDDNFATFDPATDALDFYESMEGMRVTVQAPLVVTNTNSFGETWVVASGGVGATGINARNGITISDGDFNPERIQIDDDANLSPVTYLPDHSQGDVLGNVTGIMNYAFSSYEVLVTETVSVTTDVILGQETTILDGDATNLTIATYNVENLDPTDPQSQFDAIASQIVNNLSSPDIVGLQEVQDADGAGSGANYSGALTAQMLIDAIVAAGGPAYLYVEVAPTSNSTSNGEANGNIRNGFLYNPARVTYVVGSEELILGGVASGARYPLAVDFLFNGETVTVINNHFTSRNGSDPLMGDNQPPNNAGDSARLIQAQAVRAYIESRTSSDPELNIVTLGDFNSYYFEAPLQALQAGGTLNNLFLLLPEEERYTYLFEGNLQPFDNILVGANLFLTSQFDAVHVNAELPEGTGPSDHDPTVARIRISADDIVSGTSGNDVRASGAGNDLFYLNGGGNDTVSGGDGDDGFYFGGAYTSVDTVNGGAGDNDQLGLQGNYGGANAIALGSITGIEQIVLLAGSDTRFGDTAGNFYDYVITSPNAAVGPGQLLIIQANALRLGEDLTFNGSQELDGAFLIYGGFGTENLTGSANSDGFFFGEGRFGASDVVNGGGGDEDQFGLQGDYSGQNAISFGATQLSGVEFIVLLSANDVRFGFSGNMVGYDLTMDNGNVFAGQTLIIQANTLRSGENIYFAGSGELDGSFEIYAGAGDDDLIGGQQDDTIYGGAGIDYISGRGGADELSGGDGADVFLYYGDDTDQTNQPGIDSILDFASGDTISFAAIAAFEGPLTFIGNAARSGENQVQVIQSGSQATVNLFLNDDDQADLVINVTLLGGHILSEIDFSGVNDDLQDAGAMASLLQPGSGGTMPSDPGGGSLGWPSLGGQGHDLDALIDAYQCGWMQDLVSFATSADFRI